MRSACALWMALILFWALPLPAADTAREERLREILNSGEEAREDPAGLYRRYIAQAQANDYEGPAALALRLAGSMDRSYLPDPSAGEKELRSLLTSTKPGNPISLLASDLLIKILTATARREEATALCTRRGAVPSWHLIGPFGFYGHANFYTKFAPEEGIDLNASHRGINGPARWRRIGRDQCQPEFKPWDWVHPTAGVIYLLAQFRLKDESAVALRVRTTASSTLWLDGVRVAEIDRLAAEPPLDNRLSLPPLAGGWHRLLVKLYTLEERTALDLRLVSPDGSPLTSLVEWETTNRLHPAPASPSSRSTIKGLTLRPPQDLQVLRRAPRTSAPLNAAASLTCLAQHQFDDALHHARIASQLEPKNPWWQALLAKAELAATHLTRSRREHNAQLAYRAALNSDPNFGPALMGLSGYEQKRKRYREAVQHCSKLLAANPQAPRALAFRALLAIRQDWSHEAGVWSQELHRAHPKAMVTHAIMARLARRKRDYASLADWQARTAEDDSSTPKARLDQVRTMIRLGQNSASSALLEEMLADPSATPGLRARIGQLYERLGDLSRAEAVYRDSLSDLENDDAVWRSLGDLLFRTEQKGEALRAYERSLRLRPEQHDLRRLLQRLHGEEEGFWHKHLRDPFRELEKTKRLQPRGSTARVIDQTIITVYPDGSYANFTHELQKVLRRSGITDAGTVPIVGDMLTVRTILADGRTLEPVRVPGTSEFTMPGLRIGAAVEDMYLQDAPAPFDRSLRFAKWYFRSPRLEEEFLLSEYIIRVPGDYPFVYAARNIDKKRISFKVYDEGDMKIYHWIARNMPRAVHEEGAPDIDEMLPFVEIGGKRTWQDMNHLLMNAYLGRNRVTRSLRQTQANLTRNAKTLRDRIERLHRFVCTEIDEMTNSASASQILEHRAGDRLVLLMALLKAANIESRFVAARPPSTLLYSPNWNIAQARHFPLRLLMVPLPDNEQLWLDTRYATLGCGELLEDTAGATAFVIGREEGEFHTLPPWPASAFAIHETRTLVLPEAGEKITISGRRRMQNTLGHTLKEELAREDERSQRNLLEDHLSKSFPGLTTLRLALPGLQKAGVPYAEVYEATVDTLITRRANGTSAIPLSLSPFHLLPTSDDIPEERQTVYHLDRHLAHVDEVTLVLPSAARIRRLPRELHLRNRFGFYLLKVTQKGNRLRIRRRCEFQPQRVRMGAWREFVRTARAIEEAEHQMLEWGMEAAPQTSPAEDALVETTNGI